MIRAQNTVLSSFFFDMLKKSSTFVGINFIRLTQNAYTANHMRNSSLAQSSVFKRKMVCSYQSNDGCLDGQFDRIRLC